MGKKGKSRKSHDTEGVNVGKEIPDVVLNRRIRKLSHNKMKGLNVTCNQLLNRASAICINEPIASQWETHKEIYHLLSEIIRIESDLCIHLPERSAETVNKLTNWVVNNGGIINGVSIDYFDGYNYGIKAERDIKDKEVIIKIPRDLMMTVENIPNSPLRALRDEDMLLQQMPNIALAILLLIERFKPDNPSYWISYINMLPSHYTTPLYYSLEDFEELRGSPLYESAMKLYKNIARQYAYFRNLFLKKEDAASNILRNVFTFEQYRWAVSTVMTRQNFIPSVSQTEPINALIPFWDICNHSENKTNTTLPSTTYDFANDCSVCEAFQKFAAGEQVFIYYGIRSNADFLMHNGFVYPDNMCDNIHLKFGISHSDPHLKQRTALLQMLDLLTSGEFVVRDKPDDPFDSALIAFIRVFKMNLENLDNWSVKEEACSLLRCPLFTYDRSFFKLTTKRKESLHQLDLQVLIYLQTRLTILLKSYPTTIMHDEKLLASGEFSITRKLIVMQRLKEKQILKKTSDYCLLMIAKNGKFGLSHS